MRKVQAARAPLVCASGSELRPVVLEQSAWASNDRLDMNTAELPHGRQVEKEITVDKDGDPVWVPRSHHDAVPPLEPGLGPLVPVKNTVGLRVALDWVPLVLRHAYVAFRDVSRHPGGLPILVLLFLLLLRR